MENSSVLNYPNLSRKKKACSTYPSERPYRVYTWIENKVDYFIVQAYSKEDAVKRLDLHPKLVFEVWTMDEWQKYCNRKKTL